MAVTAVFLYFPVFLFFTVWSVFWAITLCFPKAICCRCCREVRPKKGVCEMILGFSGFVLGFFLFIFLMILFSQTIIFSGSVDNLNCYFGNFTGTY